MKEFAVVLFVALVFAAWFAVVLSFASFIGQFIREEQRR